MLRIMPTAAAGAAKLSRVRAWLFAALLVAVPARIVAAETDSIGTISVDGPSARIELTVTDPITCGSVAGEDWPRLCMEVTSNVDASGQAAYAFTGTLVYDADRAYYDADEDLVHPYHGILTWSGAQPLPTLVGSAASVELTATKEGHQSGLLVVVLNGIGDIPTGTRLSVALVGDGR
jgi:hypothetical protein